MTFDEARQLSNLISSSIHESPKLSIKATVTRSECSYYRHHGDRILPLSEFHPTRQSKSSVMCRIDAYCKVCVILYEEELSLRDKEKQKKELFDERILSVPTRVSNHLNDRSVEREISPVEISTILHYGKPEEANGGRKMVRLHYNPFLEKLRPELSKLMDFGVVVGEDGCVITVIKLDRAHKAPAAVGLK